jgi:hypothetical protein
MSREKTAPKDDPPVDEEDEAAPHTAEAAPREAPPAGVAPEGRALDRRLAEHAKAGFPVLVILGTAAAGATLGPATAILVLAGGALVFVIALFWSSLRTLLGETPLSGADAYALGAPRAEEEQKQAVLRALKDLEFERSVGKISEEDYRELVAKYRVEAKRLLRILDEEAQPRRQQVASLVARRLRLAGLGAEEEGADAETDTAEPAAAKAAPEAAAKAPGACAACGTVNDEDAVFCKKCGARQASADHDDDDDDDDDEADEEDAEAAQRSAAREDT